MTREEKNKLIEDLDALLSENKNFYLADISGLSAEESSDLRRLCFKREVSLKVVKNTLLKKAMERNDSDFEEFYQTLSGNTSIMFTEVGNSPAKIIKEVSDEMISWKTAGTKLYQQLPADCHESLREVEPLREIPENRPKQENFYKTLNTFLRRQESLC